MTELCGIVANTPQGHADVITLSLNKRGAYMADIAEKYEADFVILAEFGPLLSKGWQNKGWNLILGSNNNGNLPRRAMNAIAFDPKVLAAEDIVEFSWWIKDRVGRRRKLFFPVVLFRVKATGERFAVFAIHVPTRMDASEMLRNRINLRLMAYARKCTRWGIPVVIGGDRNDGHPEPWWFPDAKKQPKGRFFRLAQHQVDWLIGKNPVRTRPGVKLVHTNNSITEVFKTVSDHKAAILARFTLVNASTKKIDLPPKAWYKQRKAK